MNYAETVSAKRCDIAIPAKPIVRGLWRHEMRLALLISCLASALAALAADAPISDGWSPQSPRDEIRPVFATDPHGGPDGQAALIIRADARPGLDGCWLKSFPVSGGKGCLFQAFYKATNVPVPRRSVMVRLLWFAADGKRAALDEPLVPGVLPGWEPARGRAVPLSH
ncbi:MAG: hypothetical protein NTW03_14785 [Verrucomicrobia bacterium]|nr:hypothetical protein [Verrucomicrobiota bacterium]